MTALIGDGDEASFELMQHTRSVNFSLRVGHPIYLPFTWYLECNLDAQSSRKQNVCSLEFNGVRYKGHRVLCERSVEIRRYSIGGHCSICFVPEIFYLFHGWMQLENVCGGSKG